MQGRRLVIALAVVAAIALLAVAGLVGYIAGNRGEPERPSAAAASLTTIPPAEVPQLRPTVEAFLQDGDKSETTGSPTLRDWTNKYAVPACAAIINGIAEAFGADSSTGKRDVDLISVNQEGTSGTAVTRGANGDETIHWVFDGSAWRFTCEGIFDNTSSSTPTPAPVEPTTAAAPQRPASDPVLLQPCFDYEIGLEVDGLRCSPGDIHGPTRWAAIP